MRDPKPILRKILALKYRQAIKLLKTCAVAYYRDDESLVPDHTFDAFRKRVGDLEARLLNDPEMKDLVDPWKNTSTMYLHTPGEGEKGEEEDHQQQRQRQRQEPNK